MRQRLAGMAVALLCTLTGDISVEAQITTGVVSGALKDEQGAVVPGATVTLIASSDSCAVAPDASCPPADDLSLRPFG